MFNVDILRHIVLHIPESDTDMLEFHTYAETRLDQTEVLSLFYL